MAYTLKVQAISQSDVGTRYHVGIGIPDPAGGANPIIYGYCLVNDSQQGLFHESIDVTARDQLLTASPELIDRDLVSFPRVTQGDFSGGVGQATAIDLTRCWDSDLDLHIPGYVELAPRWTRVFADFSTPTVNGPIIAAAGSFWTTWYDSTGGQLFQLIGGVGPTAITVPEAGILCTDGTYVYSTAGGAVSVYRFGAKTPGTATQVMSTTADGSGIVQMWAVKQGTNGWWLYYDTPTGLFRADLTQAIPFGAGGSVAVPMGGIPGAVVDLVPFENGVAILMTDMPMVGTTIGGAVNYTLDQSAGFSVWYSDGATMTLIARVEGLQGMGMCVLGSDLYVSGQPQQAFAPPALIKVNASEISVVAQLDVPPFTQSRQTCGQPVTNGRQVFWPVSSSPLAGISYLGHVVFVYDTVRQTLTHLPSYGDGLDNPGGQNQIRSLAVLGNTVAIPVIASSDGQIQVMENAAVAIGTGGRLQFQVNGWLVTSRYDFNTPGISKLIRRVTVQHDVIPTGASVYVEAHVDQDPTGFNTQLGPNPANASITNSTAGSQVTILTLPQGTIGRSMYLAIELTHGTKTNRVGNPPWPTQDGSPGIQSVSIEVSTPWAWKMTLDCTSQRKNLTQQDDTTEQGLRGRDLYWLLKTAWENALTVTFYHPNGTSYTAAIEDLSFDMTSPMLGRPDPNRDDQDFDSYASVTLRQELA